MRVFFAGDLYFNPRVPDKPVSIGQPLRDVLSGCDMACINFEGATADEKTPASSWKIGPCIRQDTVRNQKLIEQIAGLCREGIVFDLSNNHIMDYGQTGLRQTEEFFRSLPAQIQFIGAGTYDEAYQPLILRQDGLSIGILAGAEGGFGACKYRDDTGYAWLLSDEFKKQIHSLSEQCDHVVVLCHAGLEEVRLPLPEFRDLYRSFIDAGADLVVAHHPHIIQGTETYGGKQIFYSLGNFMFDDDSDAADGEYNGSSLCLTADFDRAGIAVTEVPALYRDGIVDVCPENLAEFHEATQSLLSSDYDRAIAEICKEQYKKVYSNYYCHIHGCRDAWRNLLMTVKRFLLHRDMYEEGWLYHNLEIETHRWTVMRGLEEKVREERHA